MDLNNTIFSFLLLFLAYFSKKYFLLILKKNNSNLLIDSEFKKPQAFHESDTFRLGGLIFFTLLSLVFLYLYFFKNILLVEYMSFSVLFFLLGLLDDLKINIKPKFRLLAMTILLITLVIYNSFYITKSGLNFLDSLLKTDIFALFFICLCFLFIINGANLIDGFNGLLGIHALIIFIILFIINVVNGNNELAYILFYISLLTLFFLKFNFPKAQIFLGDGGAYLIGALIAVSVIKTSILLPSISPFFFCTILFYLFFEVFFSFFRKIFFKRQTPLFPDNQHLHMCLYRFLLKKYKKKLKSNYFVSIYINFTYLLLMIPNILFFDNGLFCRFYFLLLVLIYIYFYRILYNKGFEK